MKNITKKEMIKRVKDTNRMYDKRVVDTTWDRDAEILTVIAITAHHNVVKYSWYYEPDDDTIHYMDGVSGYMGVMYND